MNLQETLYNLFNKRLGKGDCLFNWYAKDLKSFTDDELRQLINTCAYFANGDTLKLAKTIQARVANEIYNRDKAERTPQINIKKNRGKK